MRLVFSTSLSMPWIFRDTWSLLSTGVVPPPPTIQEKCQIMRDHFAHIVHFESERRAVFEFRKRVSWYAKQMNPCRRLREDMRVIDTEAQFDALMKAIRPNTLPPITAITSRF